MPAYSSRHTPAQRRCSPPPDAATGDRAGSGPRTFSCTPGRSWRHTIRQTRAADLAHTARLHVDGLPVGLFPRLGVRFVSRWHRTFVDSPHAVALVAVDRDPSGREEIVGFLMGATDGQAFTHEVLTRHRSRLLYHGVLALAVRPGTLLQFAHTRLRPYVRRLWCSGRAVRRVDACCSCVSRPTADLTAVAVAPRLRRAGVGQLLVGEFLDRCSSAGSTAVELVAAISSSDALAFYSATGWTAAQRHVTRDGVPVQRFRRRLDRDDEA